MEPISGELRFTRLENVIYGPGKTELLARELERRGLSRVLVVTGKTLGRSPLLGSVTGAIGERLAGVFAGAVQHVPSRTAEAATAEARRLKADCMVSFGGGSPIDTVKVAAMTLLREGGPELVHIAIPTTLSAGEFTPFGGVTDEVKRHKGGVGDPRLQARTVIMDPALTVETPAWLWASTGIKALDHAVEVSYNVRHQIFGDTLCAKAIALLAENLLPSLKTHGAEELAHRGRCQLAAMMSISGAGGGLGISHALGHQIGARWDVPHGVTSCITMPHVMRFMASFAGERFAPIAEGFGVPFDPANPKLAAMECADRTARFIASLSVPTRLSQVGVAREELPQIAQSVLEEINRARSVGKEVSEDDLVGLLEAAY